MAIRHYLWLPCPASRSRTHPPYGNRSRAICPEKSTGVPELLHFFLLTVSTSAAGLLRNGRRNTTTRRALVHPVNCNTSSLPCHPCPASTQSSLLKICPMSFFTFPLCLSLNTYPSPRA